MILDFTTLDNLRTHHPAWRLQRSDHAPLVASFLHRARIASNVRVLSGDVPLLDDTEIKDRFQQFTQLARELLTDFREVEHNFRQLDRRVRERIALWEGAKGELLEEIMGERDAIGYSDQERVGYRWVSRAISNAGM